MTPTVQTERKIQCRLFREEDLPSILELWEEASGWGSLTETEFRRWYLKTPDGPCIIVVAVDENNKIVAQEIFSPARMHLAGNELTALRISAPILHQSIRQRDIRNSDHPAIAMFHVGIKEA